MEYDLVRQFSQSSSNIFMKGISYFEYLKTKKYETSLWKKFDKIFFISDSDMEQAKKYGNYTIENVLYDGFENKKNTKNIPIEDNSFIFSGSLNLFQNTNNLKIFIKEIWKPFVKQHKECKLYLTGNDNQKLEHRLGCSIKELNSFNIFNLGFVDNVQETILSKKYVVSPTLYGSGLRTKVIEAMGLGKPVFFGY